MRGNKDAHELRSNNAGKDAEGTQEWVNIQKKTFTRWCNSILSKHKMEITNILTDFKTGIPFLFLVCSLADVQVPKYDQNPRKKINMIQNINTALDIIKKKGVKLINIGSEDVFDGNIKLILGLIWTLIQHFQLLRLKQQFGDYKGKDKSDAGIIRSLIVQKLNLPENTKISFSSSFSDGILLSTLVDNCVPNSIPNAQNLDPNNAVENIAHAMDICEEYLLVPKILEPKEMASVNCDDKSVMTYISSVLLAKPVKQFISTQPKARFENNLVAWFDVNPNKLAEGVPTGKKFELLVETKDTIGNLQASLNDDATLIAQLTTKPILDNLVEITIPEGSPGNFNLKITDGDKHATIPITFVTPTKEAPEFTTNQKVLYTNEPCTFTIDTKLFKDNVKVVGITGPHSPEYRVVTISEYQIMLCVVFKKSGQYSINYKTEVGNKDASFTVDVKQIDPRDGFRMREIGFLNKNYKLPLSVFGQEATEKLLVSISNKGLTYHVYRVEGSTSKLIENTPTLADNKINFVATEEGFYVIEISIVFSGQQMYKLNAFPVLVEKPPRAGLSKKLEVFIPRSLGTGKDIRILSPNNEEVQYEHKPSPAGTDDEDVTCIAFQPPMIGTYTISHAQNSGTVFYIEVQIDYFRDAVVNLEELMTNTHIGESSNIVIELYKLKTVLSLDLEASKPEIKGVLTNLHTNQPIKLDYELDENFVLVFSFTPDTLGEYGLNIYVNGKEVTGLGFKFNVLPKLTGLDKMRVEAGELKELQLIQLSVCTPHSLGSELHVEFKGPNEYDYNQSPVEDHKFFAALVASKMGKYELTVFNKDRTNSVVIPILVTPNANKDVIRDSDLFLYVPKRIRVKPRIWSKYKYVSFSPKLNKKTFSPKITVVDSQNNSTVIKDFKITNKGFIKFDFKPVTLGIHRVKLETSKPYNFTIYAPMFFYVWPSPTYVKDLTDYINLKLTKKFRPTSCSIEASTPSVKEENKVDHAENISPAKDSTKDPIKDSTKDPIKDSTKDPIKDSTKDPIKGSTKDSTKDPIKDSTKDSTKDPIEEKPKIKLLNGQTIEKFGLAKNKKNTMYFNVEGVLPNLGDKDIASIKSCVSIKKANSDAPAIEVEGHFCGLDCFKFDVPRLEEGTYILTTNFQEPLAIKTQTEFSVKPMLDVLEVVILGEKKFDQNCPIPILLNVSDMEEANLTYSFDGPDSVCDISKKIDESSMVIYACMKTPGKYEFKIQDSSDASIIHCSREIIVSPLSVAEQNDVKTFVNKPIAESTFIITQPVRAVGLDLQTVPQKLLKLEPVLKFALLNEQNTESGVVDKFVIEDDKGVVNLTIKNATQGLNLIQPTLRTCAFNPPIIPLCVNVEPKMALTSNDTTCIELPYVKGLDVKDIHLYEVGGSVKPLDLDMKVTVVDDNKIQVSFTPKETGSFKIQLGNQPNSPEFAFDVRSEDANADIFPSDVSVDLFGLNNGKLLPNTTYPIFIDSSPFRLRTKKDSPNEVFGVISSETKKGDPVTIQGKLVDDDLHQLDINLAENENFTLDIFLNNNKLNSQNIRFEVKDDVKQEVFLLFDETIPFYVDQPCQFVIDTRSTKDKIEAVHMKDGTTITYIISKVCKGLHVCTFLCPLSGENKICISTKNGTVIEKEVTILKADPNVCPPSPLPYGMEPVVNGNWAFKSDCYKLSIENNVCRFVKVNKGKIRLSRSFLNSAETGDKIDSPIKVSGFKIEANVKSPSTGLHVLVYGSKKTKGKSLYFLPIALCFRAIPVLLKDVPLVLEFAYEKTYKVKILKEDKKVLLKYHPKSFLNFFEKNKFTLDFVPKEKGQLVAQLYPDRKSFIEIPLNVIEGTYTERKIHLIKVLGTECLENIGLPVSTKFPIVIDATAFEYNPDGTLTEIVNDINFKNVTGYLKAENGENVPLKVHELWNGVYCVELYSDSPCVNDLHINYGTTPIKIEPNRIVVSDDKVKKAKLVHSSSNIFHTNMINYMVFYCNFKENLSVKLVGKAPSVYHSMVSRMSDSFVVLGFYFRNAGEFKLEIFTENGDFQHQVGIKIAQNYSTKNKINIISRKPVVGTHYQHFHEVKVFTSGESPYLELPKALNTKASLFLDDTTSDPIKLTYESVEALPGMQVDVTPVKGGLNAIKPTFEINNLNLPCKVDFIIVKEALKIKKLSTKKLHFPKLPLTVDQIKCTDDNGLTEKLNLEIPMVRNLLNQMYNTLKVTPEAVGNFVLSIPRENDTPIDVSLEVKEDIEKPSQPKFLCPQDIDMLLKTPNACLMVDLSDSKLKPESLAVSFGKLDENNYITDEVVVNLKKDDSNLIPIQLASLPQGSYVANITENGKIVNKEPLLLKIDDKTAPSAHIILNEEKKYFEERPVTFFVDNSDFLKEAVKVTILGQGPYDLLMTKINDCITHVAFVPFDHGDYEVHLFDGEVELKDCSKKIHVEPLVEGMCRRPLPFGCVPYKNNPFYKEVKPCIMDLGKPYNFKKSYELHPTDELTATLVAFDHSTTPVECKFINPDLFSINFTPSKAGLHMLNTFVKDKDNNVTTLFARPIYVEENIQKYGVEARIMAKNITGKDLKFQNLVVNDNNVSNLSKTTTKSVCKEFDAIKTSLFPPARGNMDVNIGTSGNDTAYKCSFEVKDLLPADISININSPFEKRITLEKQLLNNIDKINCLLLDPNNCEIPCHAEVDGNQLIVGFVPELSGIYTLKTKCGGYNLSESPFKIYSALGLKALTDTDNILTVRLSKSNVENLHLDVVGADNVTKKDVPCRVVELKDSSAVLEFVLNTPKPGLYEIRAYSNDERLPCSPTSVFIEQMPEVKLQPLQTSQIDIPISDLSITENIPKTLETTVSVNNDGVNKEVPVSLMIETDQAKELVSLALVPTELGLNVLNPTIGEVPLLKKPLEFYVPSPVYETVNLPSKSNNIKSFSGAKIFLNLDDFPNGGFYEDFNIDGLGMRIKDKNDLVMDLPIVKNNDGKLGFFMPINSEIGEFSFAITKDAAVLLASVDDVHIAVADHTGGVKPIKLSTKKEKCNVKVTHNGQEVFSSKDPLDLSNLALPIKIQEYGFYNVNVSQEGTDKGQTLLILPEVIGGMSEVVIFNPDKADFFKDLNCKLVGEDEKEVKIKCDKPKKSSIMRIKSKISVPGDYKLLMSTKGKKNSQEEMDLTVKLNDFDSSLKEQLMEVDRPLNVTLDLPTTLQQLSPEEVKAKLMLLAIDEVNTNNYLPEIVELKDNAAAIKFTPQEKGENVIGLYDKDSDFPTMVKTKTLNVSPNLIQKCQITLDGKGLKRAIVNKDNMFNMSGKNIRLELFTITCDVPSIKFITTKKVFGGYTIKYKPSFVGVITITMEYDGLVIPKSPYRVIVTDDKNLKISEEIRFKPEKEVELSITSNIEKKFDKLSFVVEDPKMAQITPRINVISFIQEKKISLIKLLFYVNIHGIHTLKIRRNDKNKFIKDGIKKFYVGPWYATRKDCSVFGASLEYAFVNETNHFNILGKTDGSVLNYSVEITGPTSVCPYEMIQKSADNTAVEWKPEEEGDFKINLTYNDGKAFVGFPKTVPVKSRQQHLHETKDLNSILLKGDGLTTAIIDYPNRFSIMSSKYNTEDVNVTIVGSKSKIDFQKNTLKGKDKNTTTVTYSSNCEENITISIKYENTHLGGSPYTLKSVTDTSGVELITCSINKNFIPKIGVYSEFFVDASKAGPGDIDTNIVTSDGKTRIIPEIRNIGSQIYKVQFNPEIKGNYMFSVKFNGTDIPGSPYKVNIR